MHHMVFPKVCGTKVQMTATRILETATTTTKTITLTKATTYSKNKETLIQQLTIPLLHPRHLRSQAETRCGQGQLLIIDGGTVLCLSVHDGRVQQSQPYLDASA